VVQYEADERAGPGSVVLKLPGGAGGKQPVCRMKVFLGYCRMYT